MRRAAHQLFDHPKVLDDPLALAVIGRESAEGLKNAGWKQRGRMAGYIRAFMAARSRLAEDQLTSAVGRGTKQYVILGAGLDTFAYRNPFPEDTLHVFEVDHPATQDWKRRRLAAAGIAIPPSVTFSPVDFARQTLADGLEQAGFERKAPAFFSWLGVIMYLEESSIVSTLEFAISTGRGGGIVFDYAVARGALRWMERMMLNSLSRRVAAAGEPFRSFFEPRELVDRMERMGFRSVEDFGTREINERYFKNRADRLRVGGNLGHMISAEI